MLPALWIFFSCQPDVLIEEKIEFDNAQWIHGDNKSIVIEAVDTSEAYVLQIEVTHADDYPFQNLYIRTLTQFPSGKEIVSVSSLELLNPDGTWAGKCRGKKCSVLLPLQTGFTFPEKGKYNWQIEPYMRKDTVNGLHSIAISVKRRAKSEE